MLTTEGLTLSYGSRSLWRDISVRCSDGSMTALTGISGSGKSTLLNCLGLLVTPTSGRIVFDDVNITALGLRGARRFRRDKLGYLFQNYALIEDGTIAENLLVACRSGRRRSKVDEAMEGALEQVGLGGRLGDTVARLSGGEQQRVAIARLLLKQPRLVLADEPTGALDRANAEVVVGMLRALADRGACVIVATHDEWVRSCCDASVVLNTPDTAPPRTGVLGATTFAG